jgi:hypothetical protein
MLINRSNFPTLLRPGLKTVFANYQTYPDLWKRIYSQHISDKAVEYEMEMQGLGLAQSKFDGSSVAAGTMNQAYESSYVNQYYGISFQITRAAIMDNLYQSEFPQQALQLRNSLSTLKNTNAAAVFNNAFTAASTGSDGQPLCSTVHPIANGTLANTFNNGVGFNEAAVEDAITLIKSWENMAGLKIDLNSVKVLVPQSRAFDASRIFKSEFRTGSGTNDINALYHDKYMPGGYIINQFITNPNYWFILTDEPNGFKFFQREKLEIDFVTDVVTDNVTVRAIERYCFGYSNWRGAFGSTGA